MTNTLVASAVDSTTPFQGAFLLEDGEALVGAIRSGNWVEGGLAAFSAVGDTVAAVMDPLGSLIASGLGWVMEHIEPLKGWLDELTGDADEVAAFAQTWSNISAELSASGDELVRILGDLDDADGEAVQAYLRFQRDAAEHLHGAASWADAMSIGLQTASMMVQLVHDLVRDAIAQVVGSVISYAATLALSLGAATPYVIAQATSRAASLATRVGSTVTKLLRSSDELLKLVDELGTLFKRLDDLTSRMLRGSRGVETGGIGPTGQRPTGELRGLFGGRRTVVLSDGSVHEVMTSARPFDAPSAMPYLIRRADDYGISIQELRSLIHDRPVGSLSQSEAAMLLDIRQNLPAPKDGEIMQKIIDRTGAENLLSGRWKPTVSGFVAKFSDALRASDPREMFGSFGLDYAGNPFQMPDGRIDDMFAIRFEKSPAMSLGQPIQELGTQAGVPNLYHPTGMAPSGQAGNPFLGNGFVGRGEQQMIPEYHLSGPARLQNNAAMWRVRADGGEELVAVLINKKWVRTA